MAHNDTHCPSKSAFSALLGIAQNTAQCSKSLAKTDVMKSMGYLPFCYFCYTFAMRLLGTGIAIAKIANTFRYCYFARPQLLNSARVTK